jgi:hypothetical protein
LVREGKIPKLSKALRFLAKDGWWKRAACLRSALRVEQLRRQSLNSDAWNAYSLRPRIANAFSARHARRDEVSSQTHGLALRASLRLVRFEPVVPVSSDTESSR